LSLDMARILTTLTTATTTTTKINLYSQQHLLLINCEVKLDINAVDVKVLLLEQFYISAQIFKMPQPFLICHYKIFLCHPCYLAKSQTTDSLSHCN
jgi:hypothetical protein